MGYLLAIITIVLAFACVVMAGYGKARAAKRRAAAAARDTTRQIL